MKRLLLILIVLFGLGCASGQNVLVGHRPPIVVTPPPIDPPGVPTLTSPVDSTDSVSINASLAWGSVDSADSYTINVATDTGFTSVVVNSTIGDTVTVATSLDSGTAYYWRVRANNTAGSSSWASYWMFTTIAGSPPIAPTIVSPANGADSVSLLPLLTWVGAATSTSHTVQMSLSSGFLSLLLDTTVTGTSVQVTDTLTNSTLYYWRVRSTNVWGTGPYATASFTATPTVDSIRPAPVTTLAVYLHDTTSVSLKWTAVGDDSLTGTATSYDLRYSTREYSTGNLVTNGTFETDTSGWAVLDGPATISRSSLIKRTGSYSLKVVNGGGAYAGVYDSIATTSSDSVYLSFYVYSTGIDTIDGWVLNDTGAVIGTFATDTLTAGVWNLVTVNRKLPGTQTAILVGFNWKPGVSGDSLFLDDVTCTIGKDFDFFTQVSGEPTPKAVTLFDSCTVSGLAAQTTYYFVLKVTDNEGNVSAVSNVVTQQTDTLATTPPADETFDYIVATNGSDSNPGTLALPFLTIGHAQSIAVAGDTIRMRAGTYHECIQFTNSGTASDYIVYSNYNGESVTIDGDIAGRVATLGLGQSISNRDNESDSVKYIRLENLTVTYRYEQDMATGSFYHPVLLGGANTHHIVLDSLTFTSETDSAEGYSKNWKHYAICILKTHDITVTGCTVTGVKGGGFKFAIYFGNMIPPSYQVWENNTMTAWGSVVNVGELNDYADSTKLHKSRITGNNFYGAWEEDAIQFESGYSKPSYAESLSVHSGWYINNNDLWDCAENLIDLKGQREQVWVDGNRMWWSRGDNNGVVDGTGTEGGAGLISKARNSKYKTTWRFNEMWNSLGGMAPYVPAHVYHNTVVNNNMSHAGPRTFASGFGIQWGQGSIGDILRYPSVTRGLGINNICVENRTSTFSGGNAWVWSNSDTLELDYNLYYDSTSTAKNKTLYTGLNEADTKAEWLAALKANPPSRIIGGDSGSVWADPLFTTAPFNAQYAEHTFEVDAGSPAVGAARCLTRTINAGTGSTSLAVLNPRAIFGGWSEISLPGDTLIIGTQDPVAVTAVDNDTKIVTLAEARTWTIWTEVWLQRNGIKVNDIGARQQ